MGYVKTHWHAMLVGAGLLWAAERFLLPRLMGMGGDGNG